VDRNTQQCCTTLIAKEIWPIISYLFCTRNSYVYTHTHTHTHSTQTLPHLKTNVNPRNNFIYFFRRWLYMMTFLSGRCGAVGTSGWSCDSLGGVSACSQTHQHACFHVPGLQEVAVCVCVCVCSSVCVTLCGQYGYLNIVPHVLHGQVFLCFSFLIWVSTVFVSVLLYLWNVIFPVVTLLYLQRFRLFRESERSSLLCPFGREKERGKCAWGKPKICDPLDDMDIYNEKLILTILLCEGERERGYNHGTLPRVHFIFLKSFFHICLHRKMFYLLTCLIFNAKKGCLPNHVLCVKILVEWIHLESSFWMLLTRWRFLLTCL